MHLWCQVPVYSVHRSWISHAEFSLFISVAGPVLVLVGGRSETLSADHYEISRRTIRPVSLSLDLTSVTYLVGLVSANWDLGGFNNKIEIVLHSSNQFIRNKFKIFYCWLLPKAANIIIVWIILDFHPPFRNVGHPVDMVLTNEGVTTCSLELQIIPWHLTPPPVSSDDKIDTSHPSLSLSVCQANQTLRHGPAEN